MVQPLKTTGLFLLLGLLAGSASADGGGLSGAFDGALGQVEFQTASDGRVVGLYAEGGPCAFDARRPVLDGELTGNVFVGHVTVCQTGPACEDRVYPILGVLAGDEALTALVKLDPGCRSPALEGRRLLLSPLPEGGRLRSQRPAALSPGECEEVIRKGVALLERRDYAGASHYFALALSCNDQHWGVHLGVGVAELRRGRLDSALASLERARELSRSFLRTVPEQVASIHYNLACAHARKLDREAALRELSRALDLGWADPKQMTEDGDLRPLRDDPGFKSLVDRAWDLQDQRRRGGARTETR